MGRAEDCAGEVDGKGDAGFAGMHLRFIRVVEMGSSIERLQGRNEVLL